MHDLTALILRRLGDGGAFVSGEVLCREFSMTRSAVWKHVALLRRGGYVIDAVPGRGYRLVRPTSLPVAEEVMPLLTTERMGRSFLYLDSIGSTNVEARRRAAAGVTEGFVVVADHQEAGRGRLGRQWFSPAGANLYWSLVLRPQLPLFRIPQVTLLLGLAVRRALREAFPALEVMVKWPNDLFVGGRKVCGILCEMQSEPDLAHFVVAGVGVNVNVEAFPVELQGMATSLWLETGRVQSRAGLLAGMLNHFEPLYDRWLVEDDLAFVREELAAVSFLTGRDVVLEQGSRVVSGRVCGMSERGELLLTQADGTVRSVASGEAQLQKS